MRYIDESDNKDWTISLTDKYDSILLMYKDEELDEYIQWYIKNDNNKTNG